MLVAAGCGKTTLAHFLASGEVLLRSTPTVGCNTFVKVSLAPCHISGLFLCIVTMQEPPLLSGACPQLIDFPEEIAYDGAVLRTRPYFVELWDIGMRILLDLVLGRALSLLCQLHFPRL